MYGDPSVGMVEQSEQLGTGHAVQMALPELVKIAKWSSSGDVPLITSETISQMLDAVTDKSIGLLTIQLPNPSGYGRIIRDGEGEIEAIVEQKDASPEQLEVNEVNTGVMSLSSELLAQWLPLIDNNNAQGEYYLTDLIAIAGQAGYNINAYSPAL